MVEPEGLIKGELFDHGTPPNPTANEEREDNRKRNKYEKRYGMKRDNNVFHQRHLQRIGRIRRREKVPSDMVNI